MYVLYPDPGTRTLEQLLDRWPTAPRTLAAAAAAGRAAGDVDIVAVVRAAPDTRPDTRPDAGPDGVPHRVVHRDGVTFHAVVDRSRVGWRVAWAARRHRPHVVHQNGFVFPLQTAWLRLVAGRGSRLLVQHHGELPDAVDRRRWRVARHAVHGALFTGGEAQAASWRAAGVLLARHTVHDVLESSTDLRAAGDRAACRVATGVHGDPAVLWVGRLHDGKDPDLALAAFARFARCRPTARLWMLCTERSERAARALAAAVDSDDVLAGRVHLLGPVAHATMGAWFGSCELFLTTSRHEGSGYALIEAIACGCVPVWSDLPPHRAIAGRSGRSFPVGDELAAAEALGDAARSLVVEAGAVGEAEVGWDRVARELLGAYRATARRSG